jgi:hypothetical protein
MSGETGDRNSNPQCQKCGSCGRGWDQWPDFILDPEIRPIGFQMIPGVPDANLLVFEHRCGSSISVLARRLRHIFADSGQAADLPALFGTEMCSGLCRFLDNLEACDRPCINARDRRLVLAVLKMKSDGCETTKPDSAFLAGANAADV